MGRRQPKEEEEVEQVEVEERPRRRKDRTREPEPEPVAREKPLRKDKEKEKEKPPKAPREKPPPAVASGTINPAAFKGGFSEASLLSYLSRDVLKPRQAGAGSSNEGAAAARASLEKVHRLLGTLDRADVELQQLYNEVSKKVFTLHGTFSQQEAKYKNEVDSIESNSDSVRDCFRDLEARMNRISQVGTRIGDRLQTADGLRTRAIQLVDIIGYLRQFSELGESNGEFRRKLPPVFWEDGGLHEAAVLTRRLTALAVDAMSAQQRSKLLEESGAGPSDAVEGGGPDQDPSVADGSGGGAAAVHASSSKGSLEYTHARLTQYSVWLEQRMVQQFDRALERDDLKMLCESSKVMMEFGRGKAITQRYVSTHPMLMLEEEEALAGFSDQPPGSSALELSIWLQPLEGLYQELLDAVKDEASRMTFIFPDPKPAMELLMQRMFEERIKPVVDLLTTRSSEQRVISSSWDLHAQLVVTTEVYRRTRAFMEAVHAIAVHPVGPVDLGLARDSLFGTFLASYPRPELDWLYLRYHEEVEARQAPLLAPPPSKAPASQPPPPPPAPPVLEVSLGLTEQLIVCHTEALERAVVLAPSEVHLAHCVKALFHGDGPFATMQGCLLQQLAHHVLDGVEHTLDLCNIRDARAAAKAEVEEVMALRQQLKEELMVARYEAYMAGEPLPEAPRPGRVRRSVAKTFSVQWVKDRVHKVLKAASTSGAIMSQLQLHYEEQIAPRLAPSISDLSACGAGLLALLRSAEEGVLLVLRKCADAVIIQMEMTLMLEQHPSEFLTQLDDPDDPGGFTRPTNASIMVTSLWAALHQEATRYLEGTNLGSFMLEIGSRLHALLLHHIQQFTYSPIGALRLKADAIEYADIVRSMSLEPVLVEKFSSLQGLVNILVVPPETLLPLVNGSLRLDHREALKYVRLREDFAVARVEGGKNLQQLFSN